MAKFVLQLPDEIMKDVQFVGNNTEKIFGAMTKAGAEVVAGKVRATAPVKGMAEHVKISVQYKTPSDDGINTKVYFSGYLPFSGNRTSFSRRGKAGGIVYSTSKGIPVAFLANIFEYGRSTSPFPKRPFFRKAFSGSGVRNAMINAQVKESGGLLKDE